MKNETCIVAEFYPNKGLLIVFLCMDVHIFICFIVCIVTIHIFDHYYSYKYFKTLCIQC
jgi:hypothetical protein